MIKLSVTLLVTLLLAFTSSAASLDVEDPKVCHAAIEQFPIENQTEFSSDRQQLGFAVKLHCVDRYDESKALIDQLFSRSPELSPNELTYSHILQSINLNNIDDKSACDIAKLAMAYANAGSSQILQIRAELHYFSFCDLSDDNIAVRLNRLYELSKLAIEINEPHLKLAVHNQISFVYYILEQNQLSADELEVALVIAKEVSADDLTITYYNLIDAYVDANLLDNAQLLIEEYQQHLGGGGTAYEQWLLYYGTANYLYARNHYQQLVEHITTFDETEWPDSPSLVENLAIIYGLACFQLQDYKCAERIYTKHFVNDLPLETNNRHKLQLMIDWYAHQQDLTTMRQAIQRYYQIIEEKLNNQQQASKILGVAQLNNEIIRLNAQEKLTQEQHQRTIDKILLIGGLILLALVVLLIVLRWRKR